MTAYNGWANWETWNVKVWLDNDSGGYPPFDSAPTADGVREYVDSTYGAEYMESVGATVTGPLADAWGMYMQTVDWTEISDAYTTELAEEE